MFYPIYSSSENSPKKSLSYQVLLVVRKRKRDHVNEDIFEKYKIPCCWWKRKMVPSVWGNIQQNYKALTL